jgi:hypothetical protein
MQGSVWKYKDLSYSDTTKRVLLENFEIIEESNYNAVRAEAEEHGIQYRPVT